MKTIIDVRSRGEFSGGNVAGSINIPLQEITGKVEEIRAMEGPVILCCASGNRSGQAAAYLRSCGINCENGGSWMDVNYQLSKN